MNAFDSQAGPYPGDSAPGFIHPETYFAQRKDDILRDILALVAVASPSEDRGAVSAALARALAIAERLGFKVRTAAGGLIGIAEYGGAASGDAAETLGVLAHVDTVPAGDPATWTRDPLGEIAGDSVYGRGVVDDKGPLVLCLWAAKAVIDAASDAGIGLKKGLRFIIGTMEEIEWDDIGAFLGAGEALPDYGFTPDGEFPVINREKGYCDVHITFDKKTADRVGPYELLVLDAGDSENSVPDRARAVVGAGDGDIDTLIIDTEAAIASLPDEDRAALSVEASADGTITICAKGRAVHSSLPERGFNALLCLSRALCAIGDNAPAQFLSRNFSGDIYARSLGLQTRPEVAEGEFIGGTTASPDLARTEERSFSLVINLRLAYGQTEKELDDIFRAAAARYGFGYGFRIFMPALFIPKDRPFMGRLLEAYEATTGRKGEFVLAPGTSYAKAMPGIAAYGPIFPGGLDLCHEADERMTVGDLFLAGAIYARAMASILTSDEPLGR